ncbi:hypothetical protein SpCBS45565_g01762 [Spizellomyces sp. 'palustris']|nr:hypothetical protein SpCBS45565_g01762 [Spizellomyces sp. 'palustris']
MSISPLKPLFLLGPLHLGDLEDLATNPSIICPWHAYRFSLTTGVSPQCELHKAGTFPVVVEGDEIVLYLDQGSKIRSIKLFEVPSKEKEQRRPQALALKSVQTSKTLVDWAITILETPDPTEKVRLTHKVADLWKANAISEIGTGTPPERPAREEYLTEVLPGKTRRLGKGGSLESRIAILHALANVEQWAIDLAWDIIARFAGYRTPTGVDLLRDFYTDFVKVASDEAKHFTYLNERLNALGSHFGALSVHGGLWDSAVDTQHDLGCRLAIVHMVHEARGLDVNPQTIARFAKAGDEESVAKLEIIHSVRSCDII